MRNGEFEINLDPSFHARWPEAHIGILVVSGVIQTGDTKPMESAISEMIEMVSNRFPDSEVLKNDATLQAYIKYYKEFKKSYHVLAQVESVLFKGKPIPFQNPLVAAMFAAEIKNMLLTAGHDLNKIQPPLTIGVSAGTEAYISISGKEIIPKSSDMMIRDSAEPISTVIYGPDRRTCITPETDAALFTVYAPAGISQEDTRGHLMDLLRFIELFSPTTQKILLNTY
ncbi:MAG: hypothetical protein MUP22_05400 [Desulfobacterales bacterium]|nr:hypothetical protein [Desulfobacterales bacterium]